MGARDASRACAICSEDVDALRGVPRETTCAHVLCQDCAKLWFGSETTCPACNAPQKTEDARTEKTAEKASEGANASSSSRETRDAEDEREMRGAASAFLLPANPNDASASAANADADASNVARVLMERLGEEWRKLSTRCSTLERENAALSDECASLKRALSRQKALTDDAEGGGGGGELRAMPLEALDATLTEDEDEDGGGDGGGGGGDAAAACEPSELRWRRAASSSSSTIHCVSYETSDEPLHACATHPTSSRDVVVVASWDGVATIHEATTTTTTRVGRSRVLSENTTTGTPTRRTPHHLHHRDYAPIATLVGHDAGLYAVAFRASDEKLVGTASGDGGVRLWDWSDVSDSVAPCVRHIRAHDGAEVNDVAFQDGGGARWLVTASDDGTARVYDVATGARVGVAEGHGAEARSSIALVPIRPRSRGERRSLRTFSPGVSLRPGSLAFNPDTPRATPFNSASDAFQLHPDVRSYGRLPSGVRRAVRAGRQRRRARRRHRDRVVRRHRQTLGYARAGYEYRG